jgi:hypoxanthine phosphoribosyltransferase
MNGKLYIDFDEVKESIRNFEFNKTFDVILCITRGGLVPAGLLSYKLDCKKVINMKVESYDDQKQTLLQIDELDETNWNILRDAKNILVVDDVYDSGETITAVKHELKMQGVSEDKVNTFVVISKQDNAVDYQLYDCELGTWVVFPWDFE